MIHNANESSDHPFSISNNASVSRTAHEGAKTHPGNVSMLVLVDASRLCVNTSSFHQHPSFNVFPSVTCAPVKPLAAERIGKCMASLEWSIYKSKRAKKSYDRRWCLRLVQFAGLEMVLEVPLVRVDIFTVPFLLLLLLVFNEVYICNVEITTDTVRHVDTAT